MSADLLSRAAHTLAVFNSPHILFTMCTCAVEGVTLASRDHTGLSPRPALSSSPNPASRHAPLQGIETVRRDSCPAVVKLLEGCLRLLFTTRDLSQARGCAWGAVAFLLGCIACGGVCDQLDGVCMDGTVLDMCLAERG